MELSACRREIDAMDEKLVTLFAARMQLCADIAAYKKEHGLPTLDASREREKLQQVCAQLPEQLREYGVCLYRSLFALSRSYQSHLNAQSGGLQVQIAQALSATAPVFPASASVACQGVEGAYAQLACDRLFKLPNLCYFSTFEAVFSAIEKGLCDYGVIPLENSTAGSVNLVYDLMMRHNFRIVRSVRLKVDHSLLAKPGSKLSEIRQVYSHEQAIRQCSEFLQAHPQMQVQLCENTAAAAQMVAQSQRSDVAALASRSCSALYGLSCLAEGVQNVGNNTTRFICISRNLEIYPGADRTSLMMVLPHRPGALYEVLSRFYALGINLNKLESRPLPSRNFEFMFYFDLEASVYSQEFRQLLSELPALCETFSYLGSYSEVV